MKKVFGIVFALLGAFALGTNFHLTFKVEVTVLRSSGLARLLKSIREMLKDVREMMKEQEPEFTPPPKLSVAKPVAPSTSKSYPRPATPPALAGAVWNPVNGKWYPPNTTFSTNPFNGLQNIRWPKDVDSVLMWNHTTGGWRFPLKNTTAKPFDGNLFPKKEEPIGAAIRYTGGDFDEYDEDDEIIEEDDENDPF